MQITLQTTPRVAPRVSLRVVLRIGRKVEFRIAAGIHLRVAFQEDPQVAAQIIRGTAAKTHP